MDAIKTGPRVRAPELITGEWFNTPAPLNLKAFRGRFVLLDFWTFCCGNCLHVIEELRPLESAYADVLTVVGVHSPKFPHEAEPSALAAAIERYEVHHPVLSDPALELWRQYAVRAWPTLVLVDPEGYVVAHAAGEGQVSALAALLERLIEEHTARGTLHRGTGPYRPSRAEPTTLRFPAKAIRLPAARTGRARDSILIADAGHHRLVEVDLDGETVLRRFGTGRRGEPFAEPNGLTLLPAGIADYDVLAADTANHRLQAINLRTGTTTPIELTQLLDGQRTITGGIPAVLSPWDVAWWPPRETVVVAAAGVHLLLEFDPRTGRAGVLAGTTVEGLRDGPPDQAWLAQPSGLAAAGDRLWFVDAESSALRWLNADGTVHTAVGAGLFDFGHVDGAADQARLQHPLGVTALADGSVAVLDSYNGAVRRFDPATDEMQTLATDLLEPSGALLVHAAGDDRDEQDGDGGGDLVDLVVVESRAHRLVRPVPRTQLVRGEAAHVARPPTQLRSGTVRLRVAFTPAPGRKLDDRFGPSAQLSITASPPELLAAGAGDSDDLERVLQLRPGSGVLHVSAQAASCDVDAEHPACYLARQDWGVPVEAGPDGAPDLELILLD